MTDLEKLSDLLTPGLWGYHSKSEGIKDFGFVINHASSGLDLSVTRDDGTTTIHRLVSGDEIKSGQYKSLFNDRLSRAFGLKD